MMAKGFLDVARPRQAIGQAERREASPRGSVGGGRASSRKPRGPFFTVFHSTRNFLTAVH
eukprot:193649-Pyramimonas_sp.AAC.1